MNQRPECDLHTWRLDDLEERMSRLEKFILSTLIFFAISSVSTIWLLVDLPNRLHNDGISNYKTR